MELDFAIERRPQVEEFQKKHRIGLLTLVFTDIVGSTKLKQDLGDLEATAAIQRHHATVRDILRRFADGEEIGTAGDSFFLVFAKPSDAVKFSLLLQAELRQPTAGPRIADRIGIHVGEVLIEEASGEQKSKELFGMQVDTSARIMGLAEGHQILLSRLAFDSARQVLKGQAIDGIGPLVWVSHSRYQLKGIEEPMEICQVGEAGKTILNPPHDSEKAQRLAAARHHGSSELPVREMEVPFIENANFIHGKIGLGYGLEISVVNPTGMPSRFHSVTLGSFRDIQSDMRYCLLPRPHDTTLELRLVLDAIGDGCTAAVTGEAQESGDPWSRPGSGGLFLHKEYLEFQFRFPFYLQLPPSGHALVRFIFASIELTRSSRGVNSWLSSPWTEVKDFPTFGRLQSKCFPKEATWIELEGQGVTIKGNIQHRGELLSELEKRAWGK
jgi:class 3 adenylate cyclase